MYYNRFRYYDPDTGQYTQKAPIGLAGNNPTLYEYVVNSLLEFDPFGLERMPSWMPTKQGYQRHHIIPSSLENHPIFKKSGINMNGATNMIYIPVAEGIDPNPNKSLHRGWDDVHKGYNKKISQQLDKSNELAESNKWDADRIQKEVRNLQHGTRKKLNNGGIKRH